MTSDEIEAMFAQKHGYGFARWGRPIAPVVFGVSEETLSIVKGAFEAVAALAGHEMADADPELGSNCMLFFFRDWDELLDVPDLERLVPDLGPLVARLKQAGASRYRVFRFDDLGAIKAAFVFLRMDAAMSEQPAETLALGEVVQIMLLWSEATFADRSPLAVAGNTTVLRPEIAGLIRSAYDPVMPVAANDASHALRLSARLQQQGG